MIWYEENAMASLAFRPKMMRSDNETTVNMRSPVAIEACMMCDFLMFMGIVYPKQRTYNPECI